MMYSSSRWSKIGYCFGRRDDGRELWSEAIVFLPPSFRQHLRLGQRVESHIQELVRSLPLNDCQRYSIIPLVATEFSHPEEKGWSTVDGMTAGDDYSSTYLRSMRGW